MIPRNAEASGRKAGFTRFAAIYANMQSKAASSSDPLILAGWQIRPYVRAASAKIAPDV
jgi:hypothetical protein